MAKNGRMRRAFQKVFRSPKNSERKDSLPALLENVPSSGSNADQQARDDEPKQCRGSNDSVPEPVEALVVHTQEGAEENTVDHEASTPLAGSCSTHMNDRRNGAPISVDEFIPTSPRPDTEAFNAFPSEASPTSVMESLINDSLPRQNSTSSESVGSRRLALTSKISEIREKKTKEGTGRNLPIIAQGLNAPERWWDSSWDPLRYSDDYGAGAAINRLLSLQRDREKRGETSSPAFLEKKKNNEKNEFPKTASASVHHSVQTASVQVHVKDSGSHDSFEKLSQAYNITETKGTSQDCQENPLQGLGEVCHAPHEHIQVARSVSTEEVNDTEDYDITLACTESGSSSYDSLDALDSGTFYSEMESIGEITIDEETTRLINTHKLCQASEKPSKRGCFKYKYQVNSADDMSIFTEKRKKLTWYDDEANCRKSFTLKSDESFEYSLDSKSTMAPNVMVDHIWPLAASIGGFIDKLNCSGTELVHDEMTADLTKRE